ncbi:hypothetical protein HPP92_016975 [Vanilla planifolia]|uniref:Uncharacterized protein n=1 Tax=Vanilla planifolia TaxID=51239 RepID=A0A835QCZ2_VANPL|nr:hypothetical protein HPP92_017555 [Vanilla planifolia]KAG0472429.1 hypothetical protein HPP92_016975 [Vanilla planifolia]
MAISRQFVTAAVLLFVSSAATASAVHDELAKFLFPRGLLPDSVASYSIDGNGNFKVLLPSPCYVQLSDLIYYDTTIKGRISYGLISDLSGVEMRKFFIWAQITSISANKERGTLDFYTGLISERLSASMFAEIPHCKNGYGEILPEDALHISED